MQKVQNYAVKVICRASKYDRVTPLLKRLQWLTVDKYILYRYAMFVFKCINNTAPTYLQDLIEQPIRNSRSSFDGYLKVPNKIFSQYGQRSFSYLAPQIWNNIPQNIRSTNSENIFKQNLRIYLLNNDIKIRRYLY